MTTFDHESAWLEVAAPAFRSLPTSVLNLLSRVAIRCADLRQLPDCSMPWPDGDSKAPESLYAEFAALDSETLSFAARAVYCAGNWKPGKVSVDNRIEMPGADHGAHWKFSHYADQVLRERFGLPARGDGGRSAGVGFAIIEGAICVTWSSRHNWTWSEVAPATEAGMAAAGAYASKIRAAISGIPIDDAHKRDRAAYQVFEQQIKPTAKTGPQWPDAWRPLIDTDRFMVEESVMEQRRLSRMPPPDFDAMIAKLEADHAKKITKLATERAGLTWLLRRKYPISNVIYYDHTGIFSFGWRNKLSPEEASTILDFISEFPYPYELKTTERTLQGNIE